MLACHRQKHKLVLQLKLFESSKNRRLASVFYTEEVARMATGVTTKEVSDQITVAQLKFVLRYYS